MNTKGNTDIKWMENITLDVYSKAKKSLLKNSRYWLVQT